MEFNSYIAQNTNLSLPIPLNYIPPTKIKHNKGLRIFGRAMSSNSEQARNVLCRTKGDLMSRFVRGKNHAFATSRIIRHGFTLAEVLITLTIIGVVSMLTLPNALIKYEEQKVISQLRTTYNLIQNSYQLTLREDGPPGDWGTEKYANWSTEANEIMIKQFTKHLKVDKYCITEGGCFSEKGYKALS